MNLTESYKSLSEALIHAGIHTQTKVHIRYIDSESILKTNAKEYFEHIDAILIPGGFGHRGVDGKINTITYARENNIPFLGICLGMQLALVEYARYVAKIEKAHSTEFNPHTPYPVVSLITEWQEGEFKRLRNQHSNLGGTMRLGGQKCQLKKSKAKNIYQQDSIIERHRHRYEANSSLVYEMAKHTKHPNQLVISGTSEDNVLIEMIEMTNHPWFIGCQFHPEFTSTPRDGHPLFTSLITAARLA